jgi:hypothetical protein
MSQNRKITLMPLLLLFLAVQASQLAAAAEERDRGRAEQRSEPRGAGQARSEPGPAQRGPQPARPGPREGSGRPSFEGRGQVLDNRYNHGRYYPRAGSFRPSLPDGYRPYYRGGDRYYFSGGIWYAPRGPGFVVVRPPPGLVISVLPPYYSTVWVGGMPYYYADDVYYTWQPEQNGYTVAEPPENADSPSAPPAESAQDDLIIYPRNGQTKEQQAADKLECQNWAKDQSGFDPSLPGGAANQADGARANYNRAISACFEGRGYKVN